MILHTLVYDLVLSFAAYTVSCTLLEIEGSVSVSVSVSLQVMVYYVHDMDASLVAKFQTRNLHVYVHIASSI